MSMTRDNLKSGIAAGQDVQAVHLTNVIDNSLNLVDDADLICTLSEAVYKDLSTVNAGFTGIKLGKRKFGNKNGGNYSYWFEGTATTDVNSTDTHTLTLDDGTTFTELKTYEGSSPKVTQAVIINSTGDQVGTFLVEINSSGITANFGSSGFVLNSGESIGLDITANLGAE